MVNYLQDNTFSHDDYFPFIGIGLSSTYDIYLSHTTGAGPIIIIIVINVLESISHLEPTQVVVHDVQLHSWDYFNYTTPTAYFDEMFILGQFT